MIEGHVKKSDSIVNLTKALIEFQKKGLKIPKSSRNPFLKSKYADLSTILDHIQPALTECKLVIAQLPVGEHELTSILMHESGEFIESTYKMQPLESVVDKSTNIKAITPQSIGSVITYQRRYAIGAMLSLNIDDDTDAQPDSTQVVESTPTPSVRKTAQQILAEKQAAAANGSATESAATSSPNVTPAVVPPVSQNVSAANLNDKCSDQDVAEIKALIGQWEQTSPGVAMQIVGQIQASPRQVLANFTIREANELKQAITAKNISDFFARSMVQTAA